MKTYTHMSRPYRGPADMAWPFMDAQAKEELVVDQFLMGMESHELSVQVAAHGHHRMEDVLHVA